MGEHDRKHHRRQDGKPGYMPDFEIALWGYHSRQVDQVDAADGAQQREREHGVRAGLHEEPKAVRQEKLRGRAEANGTTAECVRTSGGCWS